MNGKHPPQPGPPPRRAAVVLTQTIIYWQGAYASGGYPRFFVSTAPIAAVTALHAVNELAARAPAARRRRAVGRWRRWQP